MLPQFDTLSTIAEVGIAVTGFAGIVAALGRRTDSYQPEAARASLSDLVGASLGAVFFSFVPEWMSAAISRPESVWQVSNGLYGLFRITYLVVIIVPAIRKGSLPYGSRVFAALTFPVGVFIGLLHLTAAAGFFREFHYFIYLTGLL